MRTVAFLQCLWVREPARVKRIFEQEAHNPEFREDFLRRLLFMGGLTGRRLMTAFGEEAIEEIVWDEITPEIGGESGAVFPPDQGHITSVLTKHEPGVILCFGKESSRALYDNKMGMPLQGEEKCATWKRMALICGPHPASRQGSVAAELAGMARKWREAVGKNDQADRTHRTDRGGSQTGAN